MSQTRLFYIDNLRIFLISLVVLLHFNITYGAPGDWYYNESEAGMPEIILQAMFNITNQAFFMGMFFFISAYFTAASIQRKTTGKFLNDRLIRLGIPLVVFYFGLNPLTNFIRDYFINHEAITFGGYLANPRAWGVGPMWFVETLLLFTLLYLLVRNLKWKIRISFPGTKVIVIAALLTGLAQYVIRIWLPVGWSMPYTNLQFPFFVQYIFMLVFGVVAWNNNWLDAISFKSAKQWFIFAQLMIWIVLPVMLYVGGKESGIDAFVGRGTWQSFAWAIWEQLVGFAMIIGLMGLAKKYWNKQGLLARQLSNSAYGVYIIHPPVILGISALFVGWQDINQLLKFIVLAPVALFACFLLAWIIRQIPGVKRVV
ncbi:acyltransferase family protein [Prolixibacteraceae bacterium Z1-6]|uniref:Acyltransferase family protein n=1 Tax=Draconibacterium aestuarii TaxID=2998507 RepID=A0A9X3F575_9BACT|nr:acyltransferase family protein [Prolixibacteraceae bacterium Z1-6]